MLLIFLAFLVGCERGSDGNDDKDNSIVTDNGNEIYEYEDTLYQNVAALISDKKNIIDHPDAHWDGEYFINFIQRTDNYIFAVVGAYPSIGHPWVYLFVITEENETLRIIDFRTGHQPLSMGISVYKWVVSGYTIIFGAVNDQIWLNLDEAPIKVEYTEIRVLHSSAYVESININNFQTYMICIKGYITIDDIHILSNNEIIGKLSSLQMDYTILN